MLCLFLGFLVVQATVSNGLSFDYFAAIDGCLEGLPPTHNPQEQYEYYQCKEMVFEDPFCQMFCLMHKATYRIRCDQFDSDSEIRTCYMNPNPLEYVYELWSGIYIQKDTLAPDSVLEKYKLKTGTTVAEVQRAIFGGVEKSVSACGEWKNLTISTLTGYHVECQDLPPEDRAVVEKYIDCLETAWKTCGDTIQ